MGYGRLVKRGGLERCEGDGDRPPLDFVSSNRVQQTYVGFLEGTLIEQGQTDRIADEHLGGNFVDHDCVQSTRVGWAWFAT